MSDASKIHITYDRESFWGFRDVPFHQLMGIEFSRDPDGSAVVSLPASPEVVDGAGEQSVAAVYTVAEIASALRTCDELAAHADEELPDDVYPVMLAREVRFRTLAPPRGDIAARTRFVGDTDEVLQRLRTRRKGNVTIEVRITGDGDEPVGEAEIDFYVRIMSEERLLAMTAAAATA